ncbi:tetratricopeptide repeat protein, partial [Halorhodospira neutriphila]
VAEAARAGVLGLDAAVERLGRVRGERPELAERAVLLEAELLFQAERFAAAARTYSRGLEAAPGNPDLLYGRGLARAELGDIDGAEADLRRVLERKPEDPYALNALGYTLANQGRRLEEAESLIDRALAQKPESAAILDSKGWLLYRQGRLEEALGYLERAFAEQGGGEIGAHLGEVLWELGRRQRAREVWGKAWEADPGHPLLQETLEAYGVGPDAL